MSSILSASNIVLGEEEKLKDKYLRESGKFFNFMD
jgi:hypothetical protein